MLKDVLIRTQLPLANLRAQTYDGASNMSGEFNGCQAEIKKQQPLALYTHCGAHVTHLITSKAVSAAPFIRDALDAVQELGNLYSQSGKFKSTYLDTNATKPEIQSPTNLKPICPTRWLTRRPAVKSVMDNIEYVLQALANAAANFGSTTAARASGLYSTLKKAKCYLGLKASLPILTLMEALNRSLQAKDQTVEGMIQCAKVLKDQLTQLRDDEEFSALFTEVTGFIEETDEMESFCEPRRRKVPSKLGSGLFAPSEQTVQEQFRRQYFAAIDSAIANLDNYFSATDIHKYGQIALMLTSGKANPAVIDRYPELSSDLELELKFFHRQFPSETTIEGIHKTMRDMNPQMRQMFRAVEQLLRLLLVSPASSCTAERSFSALRRIKTWLRSTMGQTRLNNLMVCAVHSDLLMEINPLDIAKEFVSNCQTRRVVFGRM
ncbi:putative zinc finger MYM-type protein 1-like [Apostichopus japonicus]|uniref:Putative zinc finger MYM-type protein 1-like n=1 Tax=Stichopus japonicus TaxID=307972 RepID=A0A2G8JZI8_STIJA|nr:putative zinc finger MYM-type protein 1-like [Apostichopus japonicus]